MNQIAVSEKNSNVVKMFKFAEKKFRKKMSKEIKNTPLKLKIASLFVPEIKPLSMFFSSNEGKRMIKVGARTIEEGKDYLFNEEGAYKDLKTGNIGKDIMNLTNIIGDLRKAM